MTTTFQAGQSSQQLVSNNSLSFVYQADFGTEAIRTHLSAAPGGNIQSVRMSYREENTPTHRDNGGSILHGITYNFAYVFSMEDFRDTFTSLTALLTHNVNYPQDFRLRTSINFAVSTIAPDTEDPELPHPDFRIRPDSVLYPGNLTSTLDIDFHRNFYFPRTYNSSSEEYFYVWLQYDNQSTSNYAELFTFQISLASSKYAQPVVQNTFG